MFAFLLSILTPVVFEAINNARLATVPLGVRTVQTAALDHFARFNSIPSRNGVPLAFSGSYERFDLVLLAEGFLDKPFTARVGTNVTIRLVDVSGLGPDSARFDPEHPGAYDLDGDGNNDIVGAKYLIEAVFEEPARTDVAALNNIMDGPALGFQGAQGDDSKGRVIYQDKTNDPDPHANPQARKRRPGTMYIYITHR